MAGTCNSLNVNTIKVSSLANYQSKDFGSSDIFLMIQNDGGTYYSKKATLGDLSAYMLASGSAAAGSSAFYTGSFVGTFTGSNAVTLLGTSSNAVTSSYSINAGSVISASHSLKSDNAITSSFSLRCGNAITSSQALYSNNSDTAITSSFVSKLTTAGSNYYESKSTTLDGHVNRIRFTHGLGSLPSLTRVTLVCEDADGGYAVGDELDIANIIYNTPSGDYYQTAFYSSCSSLYVDITSNPAGTFADANKRLYNAAGTLDTLTTTKWSCKVRAWV